MTGEEGRTHCNSCRMHIQTLSATPLPIGGWQYDMLTVCVCCIMYASYGCVQLPAWVYVKSLNPMLHVDSSSITLSFLLWGHLSWESWRPYRSGSLRCSSSRCRQRVVVDTGQCSMCWLLWLHAQMQPEWAEHWMNLRHKDLVPFFETRKLDKYPVLMNDLDGSWSERENHTRRVMVAVTLPPPFAQCSATTQLIIGTVHCIHTKELKRKSFDLLVLCSQQILMCIYEPWRDIMLLQFQSRVYFLATCPSPQNHTCAFASHADPADSIA